MRRLHSMAVAGIGALCVMAAGGSAHAADHIDAPGAVADPAADITDFYAWEQDDETIVAVLSFDGLRMPGEPPLYDPDVLYTLHIDTNSDADSSDPEDHEVYIRFGQDSAGNSGVQIMGLPGNGVITGPVNSIIPVAGGSVFTGPREDAFFFDFDGFGQTLMSGTLSFDNTRDSFAGTNVTSIVLEFNADVGFDDGVDSEAAQMWVTSRRIGN
ncbi:MAG: DUF4331 family protein [Myxococcota bacterium]